MSSRNWKFRLEDISEALGLIEEYIQDLDYSSWAKDRKSIDAVIRTKKGDSPLFHTFLKLSTSDRPLVDSNVILDILQEDPVWFEWSSEHLSRCAEHSILVVNPIIYAEVSIGFARIEELEAALPVDAFERRSLSQSPENQGVE